MLSIDEALRLVLDHAQALPPQAIPLEQALGHVLAEATTSDIDSPPHDKSIVDGYAVVASSLTSANAALPVLEEVTAGTLPTQTVTPGTATRIMTGAPLPAGADAVVMVEQTRLEASGSVEILQPSVRAGQNIMRRAASMARGDTILAPGQRLRAIELGLLAEVGRQQVQVAAVPSVAIIATGNELVEVARTPAPGQIRNSNGPLLAGLALQAGGLAVDLGIARDTLDDLRAKVMAGLAHDVLVLSGGVSAGVLDLVPQVLTDLGVKQVFHKVNLKPGKPLWFGVLIRREIPGSTLVFGLPGNPVSTLVCFELFVRPALQQLRGLPATGLPRQTAHLAKAHQQRGDRPTYWPAAMQESEVRGQGSGRNVTPLNWKGSGDLRTLAQANCLAYFPAGEHQFAAGDQIECLLLSAENS